MSIKLEISDHDGDCSDNECEYSVYMLPLGIIRDQEDIDTAMKDIKEGLLGITDRGGSGLCGLSVESEKHGLSVHDYRLTFIPEPSIKSANKT